jgi:hypothetical protein
MEYSDCARLSPTPTLPRKRGGGGEDGATYRPVRMRSTNCFAVGTKPFE